MSSLSPKQVGEIKSLYESIYEPKEEESLIEEAIFEVTDDQIRESVRIDIDETLKEYGDTLTEEEYELVEEVLLEIRKKIQQSTSLLNKIKNIGSKITGFGLKDAGNKRRIITTAATTAGLLNPRQTVDVGHGIGGSIKGAFTGFMRGLKGEKIKTIQKSDGSTYNP